MIDFTLRLASNQAHYGTFQEDEFFRLEVAMKCNRVMCCTLTLLAVTAGAMAVSGTPPAGAVQGTETIKNSIGMKLVLVPASEFMMGAEEDRSDTLNYFPYCDPKWLDRELPRHKVRITKPFYMGQYEVTLKQFLTFYHDAKYKIDAERDGKPSWGYENGRLVEKTIFRPWDPGWKIEQDHPVVYVSWNDAVAFCNWLSKKERKKYRLPTEAEWEYACRAGTISRYHFGNDPEELVRYANACDADNTAVFGAGTIASFDRNGKKTDTNIPFPSLKRRDGYAWTAPGGKFRPNNFGLYDMHGNVWEWCADWYDEHYYEKSPADDLLLFGDRKQQLWEWREKMSERLGRLRLKLHRHKTHVANCNVGVKFLGLVVQRDGRRIPQQALTRFSRRIRRLRWLKSQRRIPVARIGVSLAAWLAHVRQTNCIGIRRALWRRVRF